MGTKPQRWVHTEGKIMVCYTHDGFVMSSVTSELRKWRGNDFVLPSQIVIARVIITDLIPFWGSLLTPPPMSLNMWASQMYFTPLTSTSRSRRSRTAWDLTQPTDTHYFLGCSLTLARNTNPGWQPMLIPPGCLWAHCTVSSVHSKVISQKKLFISMQ